MATVGNLFVNIGSSTAGLSKGLDTAKKKVDSFAQQTQGTMGLIGKAVTDSRIGGVVAVFGGIVERASQLKEQMAGFTSGVKAAQAAQENLTKAIEASKAAEAALAGAKGARRNIGMARAELAKGGIDPNKAAAALKVVDTSALKAKVAKATAVATAAELKYSDALMLSAAGGAGAPAMQRATELLTAAKLKQVEAEKALGAARKSNQAIEKTRSALSAKGIDTKDLSKSLKLADVGKFQQGVVDANKAVTDAQGAVTSAASGFRAFGLIGTGAALAVAAVAIAAIAATAALMSMTKAAAKRMDALKDEAALSGMSVEALQRLKYVYGELGVAEGVATSASMKLSVALEDAVRGGDEAREKFARLGLDYKAIAEMSPDAALQATMDHLRALGSSRERIAALKDVFGKSGFGLAGAVNATNEELAIAIERANRLVLPAAMVNDLADTNDAVEAMGHSLTNVSNMMGSTFSPVVRELADAIFDMATSDTEALMGGLQGIAVVCAVIYDVIALVVNALRMVWNIVQAVAGLVVGALLVAFAAVAKVVQVITYGVEFLIGSTHSMSAAIGAAASTAFSAAGEAAKAAGGDAKEAFGAAVDALNPNATTAVVKQIGASWEKTSAQMEGTPASVGVTLNESAVKAIEKTIDGLRNKFSDLSLGENESVIADLQKQGADTATIDEARALQAKIGALEQQQTITDQIAKAQQQIAEATMTAYDFAVATAKAGGATDTQAALLGSIQDELKLREKQKQALEETASTLEDMRTKVDQIGMSEAAVLQLKLQQSGATREQISEATKLQGILDNAKVGDALKSHFATLNSKLMEAQSNEQSLMETQLSNMGLAGDALARAVSQSLAINEQIAAAEKAAADRKTVEDTLNDLAETVGNIGKSDMDKLTMRLEKAGASTEDIARAADMQSKIDASSDSGGGGGGGGGKTSAGVTDSLSTALGSITIAGSISDGQAVQNQMLTEAVKQTQSLAAIATNTLPPSMGGDAGASMATLPSVRGVDRSETELVALMQASVAELREINTNTRAFAGVLS